MHRLRFPPDRGPRRVHREPFGLDFLIFKPEERQSLVPLGKMSNFFHQRSTSLPFTEPEIGVNRVTALDGSGGAMAIEMDWSQ